MVTVQICNLDCNYTTLPCQATSCEHFNGGDCNGPDEHPSGLPFQTELWSSGNMFDVVHYTISIPEEGVISFEQDFRVYRCHGCGHGFIHHTGVVTRQVENGLGEYETVWTCACGHEGNPMPTHAEAHKGEPIRYLEGFGPEKKWGSTDWVVVAYKAGVNDPNDTWDGDYRVETCRCGRDFSDAVKVEDQEVLDDGLVHPELSWFCRCGTFNEMVPHFCDCGENPCITEYAHQTGPDKVGPCPSIGAPAL